MLCHSAGDEEPSDRGKMDQTHKTLPCFFNLTVSFHSIKAVILFNSEADTKGSSCLYTHNLVWVDTLKVNLWWPSVSAAAFSAAYYVRQAWLSDKTGKVMQCVFKSLDLECGSCQRNEGHHRLLFGQKSVWETQTDTVTGCNTETKLHKLCDISSVSTLTTTFLLQSFATSLTTMQ